MPTNRDEIKTKIEEVMKEMIYHGRHWHPRKDIIAIDKATKYVLKLMEENSADERG